MFKTVRRLVVVASTLVAFFGVFELLREAAWFLWPLALVAFFTPRWVAVVCLALVATAAIASALELDREVDEDGAIALVAAGLVAGGAGGWLWMNGLAGTLALAGIGYLAAAALHAGAGEAVLPRAEAR